MQRPIVELVSALGMVHPRKPSHAEQAISKPKNSRVKPNSEQSRYLRHATYGSHSTDSTPSGLMPLSKWTKKVCDDAFTHHLTWFVRLISTY